MHLRQRERQHDQPHFVCLFGREEPPTLRQRLVTEGPALLGVFGPMGQAASKQVRTGCFNTMYKEAGSRKATFKWVLKVAGMVGAAPVSAAKKNNEEERHEQ